MAPGKDYSKLIGFLKTFSYWAKPLESVWLLKTAYSAEQVRNSVQNHVDKNDKLVVIDVTKKPAAWYNLGETLSNWINNYL
jgi:hypothetical protein